MNCYIDKGDQTRGPTVFAENISCQVRDIGSHLGFKVLLRNVYCKFDWGKMSLIMGASESGKSTLLRVLAGDKPIDTEIRGRVLVNDKLVDSELPLWQRCGFVPEENIHHRDLTVVEVLNFAIQLRFWDSVDKVNMQENINRTIENLHLVDILDVKTKKLSSSQSKRLSIAEEMVTGPNLLLIDEPVRGFIDKVDASSLMMTLREMVNQDRTVIAAMHQPSYEVFKLFDSLLLLSQGSVIYNGPVLQAMKFFIQSPFSFMFESYNNPADFLLDISSELLSDDMGVKVTCQSMAAHYEGTDHHRQIVNIAQGMVINPLMPPTSPVRPGSPLSHVTPSSATPVVVTSINSNELAFDPSSRQSYIVIFLKSYTGTLISYPTKKSLSKNFFQSGILMRRAFRDLSQRYELIVGSCIVSLFFGLFFGWLMGNSTETSGIYNVTSLYAIGSMFILFTNVQFAFYLFNNNLVYMKEHSRELYCLVPHWLMSSIPIYFLRCLNIVLYCIMVYPIIGLSSPGENFGFFILSNIMYIVAAIILAEISIYCARTMRGCYIGITVVVLLQFIFSGLFIKPSSLPSWMAPWTPSISLIRWLMQSNFISTYSDQAGVSGTGKLFLILPSGYNTYFATLTLFGWGGKTKWFCFAMLIVEIFVLKGIVYILLGVRSVMNKGNKINAIQEDTF